MSFCNNLIRLQKENGESNYKLAKALSVSPSTVQNWREGKNPMLEHLRRLADHYGCSIDDLLNTDSEDLQN